VARILANGWTFTTPAAPGYQPDNPLWAVCDGCKPPVLARDLQSCVTRWDQHARGKTMLTITADSRLVPDPAFDHNELRAFMFALARASRWHRIPVRMMAESITRPATST
jgi:hypothetical protein